MNKKNGTLQRCSLQPLSILGQSKAQPLIDQKPVYSSKVREIVIKFDDEQCLKPWEDVREGYLTSRKENVELAMINKKQLRSHRKERRRSIGQVQSKYLGQTNSKNTIDYLKSLLAYLRTSTDRKNNQNKNQNSTLPRIQKTYSSTIPMESYQSKQNNSKGQPQWLKVPHFPAVRRKISKQRFTLDKLIS